MRSQASSIVDSLVNGFARTTRQPRRPPDCNTRDPPAWPPGRLAGGRTPAVAMRPACSHSFEAAFCEPPGMEGRALRAEIAGPVDGICDVRRIASKAVVQCARTGAGLQSGHTGEIAAVQAGPTYCRNRLGAARARISDSGAGLPSVRGEVTAPTAWR